MKRCNCWICKRGRMITKIVNGRSPVAMRKLIREMEDWLVNAEYDAQYIKCQNVTPERTKAVDNG